MPGGGAGAAVVTGGAGLGAGAGLLGAGAGAARRARALGRGHRLRLRRRRGRRGRTGGRLVRGRGRHRRRRLGPQQRPDRCRLGLQRRDAGPEAGQGGLGLHDQLLLDDHLGRDPLPRRFPAGPVRLELEPHGLQLGLGRGGLLVGIGRGTLELPQRGLLAPELLDAGLLHVADDPRVRHADAELDCGLGVLQDHRGELELTLSDVGEQCDLAHLVRRDGDPLDGRHDLRAGGHRRQLGRGRGGLRHGEGGQVLGEGGVEAGDLGLQRGVLAPRDLELGDDPSFLDRPFFELLGEPAELLLHRRRTGGWVGDAHTGVLAGSRDRGEHNEQQHSQARPDPAWHGRQRRPKDLCRPGADVTDGRSEGGGSPARAARHRRGRAQTCR